MNISNIGTLLGDIINIFNKYFIGILCVIGKN